MKGNPIGNSKGRPGRQPRIDSWDAENRKRPLTRSVGRRPVPRRADGFGLSPGEASEFFVLGRGKLYVARGGGARGRPPRPSNDGHPSLIKEGSFCGGGIAERDPSPDLVPRPFSRGEGILFDARLFVMMGVRAAEEAKTRLPLHNMLALGAFVSTRPRTQVRTAGLMPRTMADVKDLDQPLMFVDSIVNQQRAVQ